MCSRFIFEFDNLGIDMVKSKGRSLRVAKRPLKRRLTLLERGRAAHHKLFIVHLSYPGTIVQLYDNYRTVR